jgi:acetoin utilization deacetylase AcuC-like enzyme
MRCPCVWHHAYEVDIGPHVFPTAKYRLIRDRLVTEATIDPRDLVLPTPAANADVLRVHDPGYVDRILTGRLTDLEALRLEVPFSDSLREAMWLAAGGTTLTARLAIEGGTAIHLGGGFHHAFPAHGEGFCLINDVPIAVRTLQDEGRIRRALILDLDVHQGNGTAAIFASDPNVFTVSVHQQHNYPVDKPPSDLDIGLPDGASDDEYQSVLERRVMPYVREKMPEIVMYLAGADPYQHDLLGGLGLTVEGLCARDSYVFEELARLHLPVAVTLAGGYAAQVEDTIEIHCNTVRAAIRCAQRP